MEQLRGYGTAEGSPQLFSLPALFFSPPNLKHQLEMQVHWEVARTVTGVVRRRR